MEYVYVKVLLFLYPKLSDIEAAMAKSVEDAAVLSYRFRGDALAAAEYVARNIEILKNVIAVRSAIGEALNSLSAEERELVSYKYFRRGKGPCYVDYPQRKYYRAQDSALKKTAGALVRLGWSESGFEAAFGDFEPFARFYATVKEEEERKERRKRADQKSERCPSRSVGGFFPRNTKNAATAAATHNRHMTAICRALNPPELSLGSSAGGSTTETEER